MIRRGCKSPVAFNRSLERNAGGRRRRTRHALGAMVLIALAQGSVASHARHETESLEVSGLRVLHTAGQTFLTWRESSRFNAAEVSIAELRDERIALKRQQIKLRIYRSLRPITSVQSMSPVAEVEPLSAWDSDFYGASPKLTDMVRRYVIKDGPEPVEALDGLYVHDPAQAADRAYYAVTVSMAGRENTGVSKENTTAEPVREAPGEGIPVLQRTVIPARFNFVEQPTLDYYVRWESPPNASRNAVALDYLVALPPTRKEPAPVGIHLHAWGGNLNVGYGWWFNAEKGAILLSSNESPYDWWTGYHEFRFTDRKLAVPGDWQRGVVRPYTQRRLLSFLHWMSSKYSVDVSRVFAGGNSMGASGALMLAIRHPNEIAWAIGWVGVHRPALTPAFRSSYERSFGKAEWQVRFEDGTPVWDYFDDVWYLREHPDRSIGYLTFSNGRNDKGIGWKQAVDFARALQETRQPHMFVWGLAGHGQRARMPAAGGGRVMPIDIRIDQSLPAFSNCSLDQRLGSGDPEDGDPSGQLNGYLGWDTTGIVDDEHSWEVRIWLSKDAPADVALVDVTPRRLQRFRPVPGETLYWSASRRRGESVVDRWGLATVNQVEVTKAGVRLRVTRQP